MLDLQTLVMSILTGSIGLGPSLYLAFDRIPALARLNPEAKRWAVAASAGILGILLALFARLMGYLDVPLATPQEIVNAVWTYGVVTGLSGYTSSQMVHARMKA